MLLYVIVVIDFVVNTLVQYHEQVVRFGLSLFGPATHIIQRFAGCDQILSDMALRSFASDRRAHNSAIAASRALITRSR